MLKKFWNLLKVTLIHWQTDNVSRLAAALAYYTIFSLAPIAFIAIAIAGLIIGQDTAENEIISHIGQFIGPTAAQQVQIMIQHIQITSKAIAHTLITIGIILFGALGLFSELQDGLNSIWNIQPSSGRTIWKILHDRFISFILFLAVSFLFLISLILSTVLTALSHHLYAIVKSSLIALILSDLVFSVSFITIIFAVIFKTLPSVKLMWKDVILGAFLSALLFVLGKYLLSIYLATSNIATVFGASSFLIIILVWIYYSANALLIGAEFTKAYTKQYGSHAKII